MKSPQKSLEFLIWDLCGLYYYSEVGLIIPILICQSVSLILFKFVKITKLTDLWNRFTKFQINSLYNIINEFWIESVFVIHSSFISASSFSLFSFLYSLAVVHLLFWFLALRWASGYSIIYSNMIFIFEVVYEINWKYGLVLWLKKDHLDFLGVTYEGHFRIILWTIECI